MPWRDTLLRQATRSHWPCRVNRPFSLMQKVFVQQLGFCHCWWLTENTDMFSWFWNSFSTTKVECHRTQNFMPVDCIQNGSCLILASFFRVIIFSHMYCNYDFSIPPLSSIFTANMYFDSFIFFYKRSSTHTLLIVLWVYSCSSVSINANNSSLFKYELLN